MSQLQCYDQPADFRTVAPYQPASAYYPSLEDHYPSTTFSGRMMRFLTHRFDLRGTASRAQYWEEHTLWIAIFLAVVGGGSPLGIWLFSTFMRDAATYSYELGALGGYFLVPASFAVIPISLVLLVVFAWQVCTFGVTVRRLHETSLSLWMGLVLLTVLPGIGHIVLGCLSRTNAPIPGYFVPPNHPYAAQSGFDTVNFRLPAGVDPAMFYQEIPALERLRQVTTGFPINGGNEHRALDFYNGYAHSYTAYVGARESFKRWVRRMFRFSGRAGLSEWAWSIFYVFALSLGVIGAWLLGAFGCWWIFAHRIGDHLAIDDLGFQVAANPGFDFFINVWWPVGTVVVRILIGLLLLSLIPVTVRRLHDAGFSGWLVLILGAAVLPFFPSSPKGFVYDKEPQRDMPITPYPASPTHAVASYPPASFTAQP